MRTNPQEIADLVTFTEEIVNGKLALVLYSFNVKNFLEKVSYSLYQTF